LFSWTYKIERGLGIAFAKSFKRDILEGYLETITFVFMDLAGKRFFLGIYLLLNGKLPRGCSYQSVIHGWASLNRSLHPTVLFFHAKAKQIA